MKKVTLKPTKEKSLLRKHPWLFSGAIKKIDDNIHDGDIVSIYSNKDKYLELATTMKEILVLGFLILMSGL